MKVQNSISPNYYPKGDNDDDDDEDDNDGDNIDNDAAALLLNKHIIITILEPTPLMLPLQPVTLNTFLWLLSQHHSSCKSLHTAFS